MIFLGTTFCSLEDTFCPPAIECPNYTKLTIYDGEYNEIFASHDANSTPDDWSEEWDENSIMNADFSDGTFKAGNSGFAIDRTEYVVIKRREYDSDDWIIIFTRAIEGKKENFDITLHDKYAKGGIKYIYRVSSYGYDKAENSYFETEEPILSDFEGFWLMDKDSSFGSKYDLDGINTTQTINSQSLSTYSKYATVVANADNNYEQGSVSATWIKFTEDCGEIDLDASLKDRTEFKNRLAEHQAFILKNFDGRIWMARCIGSPSDSQRDIWQLRTINFEWVEIGDVNDMETLYYNNLSDVEERWWY